jgi:hypothetical protein
MTLMVNDRYLWLEDIAGHEASDCVVHPAAPAAPAAAPVASVSSDADIYDVPGGNGNTQIANSREPTATETRSSTSRSTERRPPLQEEITMANTPNNVNDPNAEVKRAARSASPSWWVPVLTIATATMIASVYGGRPTIATSLVFLMIAAVLFVARKQQRARRDGCLPQNVCPPQNVRTFAWANLVVLIVMIAVLFSAATLLSRVLPPGTALSYGAQFLSAATVLGVGQAVLAYLGVGQRSEQHS